MGMTRTRVATNGAGRDLLDRVGTAPPRRHRNWPRVGGALALAVACGAVFVLLYASAGSHHPVLALARAVPAGQQLSPDDLTTVGIASNPGLTPIPASELDAVLSRRAAVVLEPGTLLTPGDLTTAPAMPAGSTTVGLDLKPGQVPAGLAPGISVMLVATTSASGIGAPSPNPTVLVKSAQILSVLAPSNSEGSGDTQLTVVVPSSKAASVINAASAGTIGVAGLGTSGGS